MDVLKLIRYEERMDLFLDLSDKALRSFSSFESTLNFFQYQADFVFTEC